MSCSVHVSLILTLSVHALCRTYNQGVGVRVVDLPPPAGRAVPQCGLMKANRCVMFGSCVVDFDALVISSCTTVGLQPRRGCASGRLAPTLLLLWWMKMCCCHTCCSHINSHNQVRGHRTGSTVTLELRNTPMNKHTPKTVHAYMTADAFGASCSTSELSDKLHHHVLIHQNGI